jgi:(1->4)-alpha-D-glucan 1-alpha-D-glucosylmutase
MPAEPYATYRVQLHAGFGFEDAAAIIDYLAALGISHLYCSPYLQAAPGSMHGYDVVDYRRINEELGGAAAHARLGTVLQQCGLGQVLDIVPNHMDISSPHNPWWWDVLENGPASRYAAYFDVDWDPPEARLRNTVLLPVLGDHYGRVLEAGELRLVRQEGTFTIHYHDRVFPVAPRALDTPLALAAARCQSDELAFIAESFGALPVATATDQESVHRRHRNKEILRAQLARLSAEHRRVAAAIDAVVSEINANPDALDALLERQNYRLAFWRTAGRELSYRRFFDINTLIGLRVEEAQVFTDTHALILIWVAEELLQGLRVDHPDGLRDPETYFQRLHDACPGTWIVAEKILEPGERLPALWPIAGTTGYDFLYRVGGLFVDPDGEDPLTAFYAQFTGESTDYAALVRAKKHLVLRDILGSDVNRLTALFLQVCEQHRRQRDYTRHELHEVLREVIACFPVYRTYIQASRGQVSDDDVRYVQEAIEGAKAHRPDLDAILFDFFGDLLLLRVRGPLEADLVMRFQQLTGPAMAKGVEDTAFYCFNRFVALNEVGSDPSHFGVSVAAFHQACIELQQQWPCAMLATSTHDTKRSEDVRARLSLLSEIPQPWTAAVQRWASMNEPFRADDLPDRNTEYLLYQTLVGTWPITQERVVAYMEKASREAKVHTSWINPQGHYEAILRAFVNSVLEHAAFLTALEAFVAPLVEPGRITSLAQTLIKLTAPGVPDIYQGTELWDLSLVDPDNRRPVDYGLRRRLLGELEGLMPEAIWARSDEGLPKLWVLRQGLAVRRRQSTMFGPAGRYEPLHAHGQRAEHVVAFSRGQAIVTVVPRLVMRLCGAWADTTLELPVGHWHNELTGDAVDGGTVRLAELLARFPVALLSREEDRA